MTPYIRHFESVDDGYPVRDADPLLKMIWNR
jgi:hypothetical protein